MKSSKKIKEIEATRIVLRTPEGKVRAWLDATSEDAFFLGCVYEFLARMKAEAMQTAEKNERASLS